MIYKTIKNNFTTSYARSNGIPTTDKEFTKWMIDCIRELEDRKGYSNNEAVEYFTDFRLLFLPLYEKDYSSSEAVTEVTDICTYGIEFKDMDTDTHHIITTQYKHNAKTINDVLKKIDKAHKTEISEEYRDAIQNKIDSEVATLWQSISKLEYEDIEINEKQIDTVLNTQSKKETRHYDEFKIFILNIPPIYEIH